MQNIKLYALFIEKTGGIVTIFSGPQEAIYDQLTAGVGAVSCDETVTDTTHWVDQKDSSRKIREKEPLRPNINIMDLVVEVSGLPKGLIVSVHGVETKLNDDTLEIVFDLPGTYTLEMRGLVPYRDKIVELDVG